VRGGFPRSLLASSNIASDEWREQFIRTFLERDIPLFGLRIPAPALRRCWTMIAHYHAQTWNSAELARAFGVAHTTVQRYLDVLTETFMVRQLPPWHENLSRRQLRAPKVYLQDTGLLHTLLGVRNLRDLQAHPKWVRHGRATPSTSSSTISVRVPVRRTSGARTRAPNSICSSCGAARA